MRTTLEIDDDLLGLVKEMAQYQRSTAGKVVSQLIRNSLVQNDSREIRNGLHILKRPMDAKPVTMEVINQLRDQDC